MGRVSGKVALVTGAASGIGRGCAETLAREGASVVLTDVQAKGEEIAAGIRKAGGKARFQLHDVTSEGEWTAVVAGIEKEFGRLDILVNNAGIAVGGMVTELSLEDFRRQMAVNVDSVFMGTKAALPLMRKGKSGSIVNISSVAGLRGAPGMAGYSATKGGVLLFGKSLAMECGPTIRVNTVHPGIIDTPIWNKIPVDAENSRGKGPMDARALARAFAPLSRPGLPDDVAQAVLWLVSDASSYVSGAELAVDGAMTAGAFVRT